MSLRVLSLVLLALCAACREERSAPFRSAVLITLDTTRADALGSYGGRAGVTPHLDALAGESVLYESARSVAPLTLPAHASMLTGLTPLRHTVRDNGLRPLPESARTLAESARDAGLECAAFVSAAVLERAWGLAQGFDVYDEPEGDAADARVHIAERRAEDVAERTIAWIEGRDARDPFFLWVHLFDPHAPYEPAPEHLAQAGGDAYLGEVAATDAAVGRILASLRAKVGLDDLLVVVVADHGESLGQHGEATHSVLCYEPTIRVPLLVRHGDGWGAGTRERAAVSVTDVHPTLCAALGLEARSGLDGESLFRRTPSEQRSVYFESYYGWLNHGWSPLAGAGDGELKYLHGAPPELYRPSSDPREKQNLAPSEAAAAERLRAAIADFAARPRLAASSAEVLDERARDRVQRLGYAGAGDAESDLPEPLEDTGRPDARERLAELRAYHQALLEWNGGKRDAAIRGLQAIVAENAANVAAQDVLGASLVAEDRCAEAIPVLEGLLARGVDRVTTRASLGRCLEAAGDFEAALPHYRRALELRPGGPEQKEDLARVLERLGRADEARLVRASGT